MKRRNYILSVINKVIVTSQLETGDAIKVSVKAIDQPLSSKNRAELDRRISHSIVPEVDRTLYFTIRLKRDKKKDNWNKIKTITELNAILDAIFEG